jgi:hypothetical protein
MNNNIRANCRVSTPILYPNDQDYSFNGFAWSGRLGIILEATNQNSSNKDWTQWLGTQP